MKGSAITGPVGKEAAELWPVRTPRDCNLSDNSLTNHTAYCIELWRGDVRVKRVQVSLESA